jgi:hypothetical protein
VVVVNSTSSKLVLRYEGSRFDWIHFTYYGMALDLARQNAVLVQVVQLNCEPTYPR